MRSYRHRWRCGLPIVFTVDARAIRDLGMRDAEDREIFDAARAPGETLVVTKDSDFVDLVLRFGIRRLHQSMNT
jgi:predicted nuclease of predicted toxin-antitoxin system